MKHIDPNQLSDIQNYKLLSGSIIPRPIAFVTSSDIEGNVNAAPFSFFNIVNNAPPMIAISAQRAGKRKDTAINIENGQSFVVHVTDEDNVEEINKTAASINPKDNELDLTELNTISSDLIDIPAIKEAKIRFECQLEQMILLGSEDDGADLIIGKIVKYHIQDDVYFGDSKIDAKQLKPVARLAGNDYAKLGEQFTIERPSN